MRSENRLASDRSDRDCKLDRKFAAVGTHRRNLDVLAEDPLFAGRQIALQSLIVPFTIIGWNDRFDELLPDDIATRVAKGTLGRRIELENVPFAVHCDDAI